MSIKESDNLITIPKRIVEEQGGAVVLGLHEYKRLLSYEMEKEQIDMIIRDGLQEEKQGKTESMGDFLKREHPRLYANYKH